MVWVWLAVACILASLAVVVAHALCKIAALGAEEARRALEDERWAVAPPNRTATDADVPGQSQEAPLRSKR